MLILIPSDTNCPNNPLNPRSPLYPKAVRFLVLFLGGMALAFVLVALTAASGMPVFGVLGLVLFVVTVGFGLVGATWLRLQHKALDRQASARRHNAAPESENESAGAAEALRDMTGAD